MITLAAVFLNDEFVATPKAGVVTAMAMLDIYTSPYSLLFLLVAKIHLKANVNNLPLAKPSVAYLML
jgi:hypothetical protein